MIKSKDRSYYIGASDTKFVVGNWNTKTFSEWWLEKIGIPKRQVNNKYTLAGTNYEHRIIEALNIPIETDKQIIKNRLRVNLDGNTKDKIYEIKTYGYSKGFDIDRHKDYYEQVQVEMYASGIHNAEIVAYGLLEKDYNNFFNDIEKDRLMEIDIPYDEEFIKRTYIPRLNYLSECLDKECMPSEYDYLMEYPKYVEKE